MEVNDKRGRTLLPSGGIGMSRRSLHVSGSSLERKQQSDGECASLSGHERWPASQMDSSLSGSFHFLWPSFDLPDD